MKTPPSRASSADASAGRISGRLPVFTDATTPCTHAKAYSFPICRICSCDSSPSDSPCSHNALDILTYWDDEQTSLTTSSRRRGMADLYAGCMQQATRPILGRGRTTWNEAVPADRSTVSPFPGQCTWPLTAYRSSAHASLRISVACTEFPTSAASSLHFQIQHAEL